MLNHVSQNAFELNKPINKKGEKMKKILFRVIIWSFVILNSANAMISSDASQFPLTDAIRSGDLSRLEALLATPDFNVNLPDEYGIPPLFVAMDAVRSLLKPFSTQQFLRQFSTRLARPLKDATCMTKGRLILRFEFFVNLLLEHGAGVNQRYQDRTPLHDAVLYGTPRMVLLLLVYGAEVNAQDDGHNTPLQVAVLSGYKQAVIYLLKFGADISLKNRDSKTPRDLVRQDQQGIAEILDSWHK